MNTRTNVHAQPSPPHVKLALFWTVLGILSSLLALPYFLSLLPILLNGTRVPAGLLALGQSIQIGVLLFFGCWAGLALGQSVHLDSPFARAFVYGQPMPPISPRWVTIAGLGGTITALIVIALDRMFTPFMPPPLLDLEGAIPLWQRVLVTFYGGIVEELMFRLFLVTLIVWALWKTVLQGQGQPTPILYWIAIVTAALLFGVGHLPAASGIWSINTVVIARTIVLNSLLAIVFGWIYWRYGLEYAMLSHFCADIVLHVIGGS